ncbi:MAG TPA: class I SAM-dependent DNA methyltransferase [Gaiellales bacterium]|nr:class I SAM-dependent DNA methyltransferase [Gaiellales bacterium]
MITQQQLEQRLLAACNCLRGPVDPVDYKAYIFPLLFLKRISDYWDWEYHRALEAFGGDEDLARLDDNYRFVLPEADLDKGLPGCHWENVRDLHENVGAGLQTILQRIELANSDTLAGIFGDVQWANKDRLPEHTLLNVIEEFSTLDLSPDNAPGDILGAAYEYLLKYFADTSGKKAGEFFTPRSVVRLLTLILDPKEGESANDPACGSAGMLVEMANVVREHGGDARTLKLSGQEVQLTTAAIARMNLFLHDIEDFRIRRGDTLRDPKLLTADGQLERFDMVIANPPFSLTPWGHETWANDPYGRSQYGVPPATYGDMAFVEHMVATMKPETGRVAVVMPQGVLFRGGAEKAIRKRLLEAAIVEAVIGLPPNLFYNTGLPACILVFRALARAAGERGVLFVDGSRRFVKRGSRNEMNRTDVDAIADTVRKRTTAGGVDDIFSATASLAEIEANGWNLSVGRYVRAEAPDQDDIDAAVASFLNARDATRRAEQALEDRLRAAGLVE